MTDNDRDAAFEAAVDDLVLAECRFVQYRGQRGDGFDPKRYDELEDAVGDARDRLRALYKEAMTRVSGTVTVSELPPLVIEEEAKAGSGTETSVADGQGVATFGSPPATVPPAPEPATGHGDEPAADVEGVLREFTKQWADLSWDVDVRALAAALAATRQELAEARKDSERLDWLEAQAGAEPPLEVTLWRDSDGTHVARALSRWTSAGYHVASDLRAAIDAARQEARDGE